MSSCRINAVIQVQIELPEGAGEIPAICRVAYRARPRHRRRSRICPWAWAWSSSISTQEALQIFEHFIIALSGEAQPAQKAIARRLKVVVVDDDPIYSQHLARDASPAAATTCFTAVDGFEGLALCLKQLPDVIVCDVQMPRMDGWQFLRMVRARPSLARSPVVFLTTEQGDEERLRGYQLGVDDYITKPFARRGAAGARRSAGAAHAAHVAAQRREEDAARRSGAGVAGVGAVVPGERAHVRASC